MPGPVNGNGDPPPSTLAAQIVQNLETAASQPRGDARNHLRELLQMILEGNESNGASQRAFDDTLEENYRLINVIVKACLSPLSNDDPFDDQEANKTQAKDTLDVIDLTIRRSPEVLFQVPDRNVPSASPGGPLFLWLIPQLMLAIDAEDQLLVEGRERVLLSALNAQKKAAVLRIGRQPVLKYIRGCIKDMLSHVRLWTQSQQSATTVPGRIPSAETVADSCLRQYGIEHTSPIHYQGIEKYLVVSASLVQMLAVFFKSDTSKKTSRAALSDLNWVVDCVANIWSLCESSSRLTRQSLLRICSCLLAALRVSFVPLSSSKHEAAHSLLAARLMCLVIKRSLDLLIEQPRSMAHTDICSSIVELLEAGSRSPAILQCYYEQLSTRIETAATEADQLEQYESDLLRFVVVVSQIMNHDDRDVPQELLQFDDLDLGARTENLIQQAKLRVGAELEDDHRPIKKTRMSDMKPEEPLAYTVETLDQDLYRVLHATYDTDNDVVELASDNFKASEESEQQDFFRLLGRAACRNAQHLLQDAPCPACDIEGVAFTQRATMDETFDMKIHKALTKLVRSVQDHKITRPRVAAMQALKRFLRHTNMNECFDLKSNSLAIWCFVSLKSSIRDLRLAAVGTLKLYIQDGLDRQTLDQNRLVVLESLRTLAEKDEPTLHETCIICLSHIVATVDHEEEVNIALVRLVEYLGNSNPLISGMANEELLKISKYDAVHAQQLFEPYWRDVSVVLAMNLQKRPQMAQATCDILGIHVTEMLRRTQFFTIPYLVLTKQRDTLQKIASATGTDQTVFSICIPRAQLAAILAYLLLRSVGETEEFVRSLLIHASPEFENHDLSELLKTNSIYTAYELLKLAGDPNPSIKERAKQIIQFLAETTQRRPGTSRSSSAKNRDVLASFFETWSLAIVQLLSEIISQAKASQPIAERRRCIVAIKEMAIIAGNHLTNALPQICSCLRSAIEDIQLCNEALLAWLTLLRTLDEEYIRDLVDPTFAILAQHWDSFNSVTHQESLNVVEMLFKDHKELVRKIIETIPSISSIPLLSKFSAEVERFKAVMEPKRQLEVFANRCASENDTVVMRALNELEVFLSNNQSFLQSSATSEQPDPEIAYIVRSLLDACVRFKDSSASIALRCARCIGLIGCIDPTKIEAIREDPELFVLSNFERESETIDFVVFFLREVVVKAYLATTMTSRQQLLAFGMQELMKICDFEASVTLKRAPNEAYKKWIALPDSTKNTLTPFLSSKYLINPLVAQPEKTYPIYRVGMDSTHWLRTFTLDLLQKGQGKNTRLVFDICRRLVRNQDIAIASFLLPYVVLNIIVEGSDQQRVDIVKELFAVLHQSLQTLEQAQRESLIFCSQNVFRVIDYLSRWIPEKQQSLLKERSKADKQAEHAKIETVWGIIQKIPPKVISRRAVECKSFARALFYWEQYIREYEDQDLGTSDDLYQKLQEIYMEIDEPDGIEGISSCITGLTMEQQVLEDRKAGRWMAVQSWFEVELERDPNNADVQWNLLTSLRETGQHDLLLNQVANFRQPEFTASVWRPFAIEAAWNTENWDKLNEIAGTCNEADRSDFKLGLGTAISLLQQDEYGKAGSILDTMMLDAAKALTESTTSSIQACHDVLLKFHVLIDLEGISGAGDRKLLDSSFTESLDQRLELLGAFPSYKQFLLGVRRAAMAHSLDCQDTGEIVRSWLASAKIARKAGYIHQAAYTVLRAFHFQDCLAAPEHARLIWRDGNHRKAIQSMKGAIEAIDAEYRRLSHEEHAPPEYAAHSKMILAQAQLLLAKWIDGGGQTQSNEVVTYYRKVTGTHGRWDKGFYHLGKHYNKLLESERANPRDKQTRPYLEGELTKLCIENFLRSLPWGAKYLYQSLPKVLTLWLDFGAEVDSPVPDDLPRGMQPELIFLQRKKVFKTVQAQMKKYIDRLPAYIFYTAFAQIVARICHPNKDVYLQLVDLVAKVVSKHPQQAIWPLLAMMNSRSSPDRAQRGAQCKAKVVEVAKRSGETHRAEIMNLLTDGAQVSKQLLTVCNKTFDGSHAPRGAMSLAKDIGFVHAKAAPCRLVIPVEAALLANLPPLSESDIRTHNAFSKDTITISVFLDDFTVLNSLIRPRKIKMLGSDGNIYTLMCKPKDDLRKDQRLLEFNSMISRTLKKDAECSRRRLYIRTYAVTPLNEEHGLIEWVEGLRTLRDIFIQSYNERGIRIDYAQIRDQLTLATTNPNQVGVFDGEVLRQFPPVLHDWFVNKFPEPSAWLEARLRYTRSCAVMSIVGHVLGLGDRHAENILLEEAQGGTFHVDFNCLFDKGKTFDTPERVPFRLTHNMVDAFGVYKENGPFRKSCELTLGILRQYQDTLMTILETFLYDPTTDFIGKKRKNVTHDVPDSPEGVLDSVRRKVRGLPEGESVPLSEEGYVELQIRAARDPWNLARMYIGWCAFF